MLKVSVIIVALVLAGCAADKPIYDTGERVPLADGSKLGLVLTQKPLDEMGLQQVQGQALIRESVDEHGKTKVDVLGFATVSGPSSAGAMMATFQSQMSLR